MTSFPRRRLATTQRPVVSVGGGNVLKDDQCDSNVSNDNDDNDDKNQEIIQGIFSLKYLLIFTKCTNLCPTVEIYLKNSYPIILRYSIASLGEIKLCLAQQDL